MVEPGLPKLTPEMMAILEVLLEVDGRAISLQQIASTADLNMDQLNLADDKLWHELGFVEYKSIELPLDILPGRILSVPGLEYLELVSRLK